MYKFNLRVYGILINDHNQILLSDEEEQGFKFTKFPGGGLEYGEGLIDALKREFSEECSVEIEILEHLYTTDFFIQSVFNDSQVISVYYLVKALSPLNLCFKIHPFEFDTNDEVKQSFRWKEIEELRVDDVTFPTDQRVVEIIKEKWLKRL